MKTSGFPKLTRYFIILTGIAMLVFLVQTACATTPTTAPATGPVVDETKISLSVDATSNAMMQTEQAKNAAAAEQAEQSDDLQKTMDALSVQQTVIALQQEQQEQQQQQQQPQQQQPPVVLPPSDTPDPAAGMEEKIKNAKVLLYEDTAEYGIGEWIQETLDRMQIKDVTYTGDDIGIFLTKLNGPTKWDLIIIGAESKRGVQGEFWPVIMDHAHNKVAIIAEIWYLYKHGGGKIKSFTNECGIGYQSHYDQADSIYWWDQTHPVFTTPNMVDPLYQYWRFWANGAGEKLRLISGGDAKLIAGDKVRPATDGGYIAVCMEGRTIYQSFSNHDYDEGQIKDLWENYITYTLTNHFLATQP